MYNPPVNLLDIRNSLEQTAHSAGIINGPRKARYIFEHYTGLTTEDLYTLGDDYQLQPWKIAQMHRALKRLIEGVPVQLIIGYTFFYESKFICRKGVMIPRPETETLVDTAIRKLDELHHPSRVLDLFTGSGIVAISLAKSRPEHKYFASDRSRKAINLARLNASRLDVDIVCRVGDMFTPFAPDNHMFDIICANPPYIPTGDLRRLPLDVRIGDPRDALDGGPDGLAFHRRLAREAGQFIKPGGYLIVEMGYDQRKPVKELYKPRRLEFVKDLWRKDRVYIVSY